MTKLEKILMAVLLIAITCSIIFWRDVSNLFRGREVTVDDEKQEKSDKDKKMKDKKDKKDDDEASVSWPANTCPYLS